MSLKADTKQIQNYKEGLIKASCLVNLTLSNLRTEWSKGFKVSF